MKTMPKLFLAFVVTTGTLTAQNPLINLVVNAASGIPRGLPNSGVAQGSLFMIWGVGLGSNTFQFAPLPLSTAAGLAGTSITITVNGTTMTAPMYFADTAQVIAVMPSNIPAGNGTLTLTYSGKSASSPVTVVPATFGISHGDVYSDDDGFLVRSIAAATFPDSQYVSDTHTAKPGDTLTIWGTGLGSTPNNGGDTGPAPAGNIGSAPMVFVGGVPSPSVTYWGRSPNSIPGLDQINFVVPANAPLGCNVSIVVQTATPVAVSNAPTIALAATDGATCSDPAQSLPSYFFGKSGLKTMFLSLGQYTNVRRNADGTTTTTTTSEASVSFFQLTEALEMTPGVTSKPSFGSCHTNAIWGGGIPDLPGGSLDAGLSITLTPPSGNALVLDLQHPGIYNSGSLSTALPGGTWTLSNGAGGAVAPLRYSFPVPQPVTWTNAAAVTGSPIDLSKPLTITWSGGDSNGYVLISGGAGIPFVCAAPTSAGQFTIPPSILLSLGSVSGGELAVSTVALSSIVGTVPGIDASAEIATFATSAVPVAFK